MYEPIYGRDWVLFMHSTERRLNSGQAIGASLQKIWKSHSIPISTKIGLMKALVWTIATYGRESWTLRKKEETRLDAFEMKRLRKILLRVSWTAKKTNEWVLNKAGVKSELLDTVKTRKLTYYGHTMRKQGSCLEKEIMQGTMPGVRRRGRPLQARPGWQHQDVDRTLRGSVNQNDRGQGPMEKVRPWYGQPSDRGRVLKNRTELGVLRVKNKQHR